MSEMVSVPVQENTVGILLAGGRATRMGGVNKGLVPFLGEPMAGRIIKRLRPQVKSIVASVNRDAEAYLALGADLAVPDRFEGYPGPLAALDAAGAAADAEWLLTVPCDVPLIPENLLERLSEGFRQHPARALTVRTDGRDQNTIALVHRSLLAEIKPFIDRGDRKLGLWFDDNGRERVEWSEPGLCFVNVNSPEELEALEKAI